MRGHGPTKYLQDLIGVHSTMHLMIMQLLHGGCRYIARTSLIILFSFLTACILKYSELHV